jgi:hypothetical protein
VATWGNNWHGEATVPESLQEKTLVDVAAGYLHSMALASDGKVTTWGHGGYGQNDIPEGLDDKFVTDIVVGSYTDLAITSDGELFGWGLDSDFDLSTVPESLDGKNVIAAASGEFNSMALTDDGKITTWGVWYTGLNDIPASLDNKVVTAIAAGAHTNMALTDDGKVVVWADHRFYSGHAEIPASLDDEVVTAIDGGEATSMALTEDGEVVVWGLDDAGQTNIPAELADQTVTAISAGAWHELALTSEGKVVAWGATDNNATSVPTNLVDVERISAGWSHSLAVGDLYQSDFTTGVTATITGTPEVGTTLTAGAQDVAPDADSYTYRWFADNVAITGATYDTFTPTAAEKDTEITVEVTAVKAGYNSSTDLSAPTDVVAGGTTTLSGSVTVTGTPEVGETLTADSSSIGATPSADLSGRWLRDGEVIIGATQGTYVLTNADAGATITHQVTAVSTTPGYDNGEITSNGIGPVDGGVITLPDPTVTGSPVVDGILTASLGTTLDPSDADITYEWTRDGTYAGTGDTFTPEAGDVGEQLTVTATATKAHFEEATSDTDTAEVGPATFTTGPTATITGTLKVGQTLTAHEGDVAPSAESHEFQWYANDLVIAGAHASTFVLTPEQNGRAMSVKVTAIRAGYTSLTDFSTETSAVGDMDAPRLDLGVAKSALRRGQATTLTWTSDDASSLMSSGGWTGGRNESGTVTIRPRTLGGTSYVLKAANDAGTTTAMVTVQVRRPAKRLTTWASNGLRLRGKKINVSARGLDGRESYVVRVGGRKVATGRATTSGRVSRKVTIPTKTKVGNARATVTGSESDRIGGDRVRVVRNKRLGLGLAKKSIRASDDQTVTVTGLAAREKITLTYQGKRISPKGARANKHGRYKRVFDVDIYWGTKTVKARGQYDGRSTAKTFQVVRRCYNGKRRCA